ncbi:lipopolysaccharide biosynthesis protein [soil metagenome]
MKDQIVKLGKGTLTYGIGQGLAKLIGFLILPLLTTYLTPTDYGVISLLTLVSFLAAPIFGIGLGSSIGLVYFSHTGKTIGEETTWTSFMVLVLNSIILLVVVFSFSNEISFFVFQTPVYGSFINIMVVSTVFNGMINQPFIFRLQFEDKFKTYVLITVISTLLTVGLTVLMVIVWQKAVWGYMIALLIGNIITFVLFFLSVIGWTKLSWNRKVAGDLIRLGLPMISSFFFLFFLQTSGRFLLERYRGISDVGIYSIGHTFGMGISLAVTAFTTSWFPYFNSFNNKREEAKGLFGKLTIYYTLSFGGMSLLMFIFAKPLVIVLTEPSFYDSYLVIGMISFANFLVGLDGILMAGLYFEKKAYLMNVVQLGAAVTCIVFCYLFIPPMGIVGTGISLLIGYTSLIIFQLIVNKLSGTIEIEYEGRRFVYFFITSIVVVAISFIPRNFTIIQEILFSSAHGFVLLVVLFLQLKANERASLLRLFRGRDFKL